jgi:glycosyltransferase involved in cell wall biosynthesis
MVVESAAAGVGRHVIDLVDLLIEDHGVDVHLVWSPVRADAEFSGWVERLGLPNFPLEMSRHPGLRDVVAISKIRQYLHRKGPFHIAHGHSSKGGAIARLACVGTNVQVVYTPHAFVTMNPSMNHGARLVFSAAEMVLAKMTSQLVAVSPEEASYAQRFGFRPSQIAVIPNCIRPICLPEREIVRRELGFHDDDVVIGFVGRFAIQKHPVMLVEAFASVVKSNPQALLLMIGDGPLMSEVRRTVDRYGIGLRVRLLGARAGRPLMPGFDIFALPSRFEGLPYVVLEAMSAGLPLVITSGANCSVLVEQGVNGLIVPTENVERFAMALTDLVSNIGRRNAMGQASKRRVSQFDLPRMVSETHKVYTILANGRDLRPS